MQVKVKFEEEVIGYEHSQFHWQSTDVAAGAFEVVIDGKKERLSTGDGLWVPPN